MTTNLDEINHMSDALSDLNGISPHCISWPWLHENAFLQTDLTTNLDWFDFHSNNEQFLGKDADTSEDHHLNSSNKDVNHVQYIDHTNEFLPQRVQTPSLHLDQTDAVGALVAAASISIKDTPNPLGDNRRASAFYDQLDDLHAKIVITFTLSKGGHSEYSLEDFIKLYVDNFWQLW